ncbi:MAG: hypothetical protein H6Q41_851 [Deltaproteobacteria bacterium]|jgi:hypothetical protein|nr:hypothetical protein [Deltaproteobacteria bacterium]
MFAMRKRISSSSRGPVASISGGIMGDETIESYYFSSECEAYIVEIYHDRFLGEDEVSTRAGCSLLDSGPHLLILSTRPA